MPDQAGSLITQVGATQPCKAKEFAIKLLVTSIPSTASSSHTHMRPCTLLTGICCLKAFHAICLPPGDKPWGRQAMAGTALAI